MASGKTQENSYGNILKATSFLGGVQVFQALVNLVRGKFVAIFLGFAGMGISALFTSAASIIQKVAQLGFPLALTREIAEKKENPENFAHTLKATAILSRICALAGAAFCFLAAPWLSRVTFSSGAYTWQFRLLAVMIFFAIDGAGKLAQLQGVHAVKRISSASVAGALTGLCIGIPLYWKFGNLGIVPAMCALSFVTWSWYSYSVRKCFAGLPQAKFSRERHMPIVKRLLALGILLMAGDLIGTAANYFLNVFLRHNGGIDTVGFFQAATSLTNQYSGVVFSAMSIDYFPRLTAAAHSDGMMCRVVNRQLEIVSLIIGPLIILLLLTAPIVIHLFLSVKFLAVTPLLRLIGLGVLLQAINFPLGYITFAKKNKRLFFWLEAVVGNIIYLGFAIAGYLLFGIKGLGYGMIAEQLLMLIIYIAVSSRLYKYSLSKRAFREIVTVSAAAAAVFFLTLQYRDLTTMTLAWLTAVSLGAYSFTRLRNLIRKEKVSGSTPED